MTDIEKAANIIKDLAEKNPEATKELGKTAVTLTKAINVALTPISLVVWGYDKISDFLQNKLSEKLKNIPEDNIITPPINIAGPTIEAMRFTGEDDELREMYANLLANSMDKDTVYDSHPRFVEIIKNITSEEARMLSLMQNLKLNLNASIVSIRVKEYPDSGFRVVLEHFTRYYEPAFLKNYDKLSAYLNNLMNLGLIRIDYRSYVDDPQEYTYILNSPIIINLKKDIEERKSKFEYDRGIINLTDFGKMFIRSVVKTK